MLKFSKGQNSDFIFEKLLGHLLIIPYQHINTTVQISEISCLQDFTAIFLHRAITTKDSLWQWWCHGLRYDD